MIKRSKFYGVIALSLLMSTLGGCSKETATVTEVMEEIKTTEVSDTEDTALALDDVILQVEDSAVSYREVLFYIYQAKQEYEGNLSTAVWDVALQDGHSFEAYAKEELLRQITEIHVICEQAKKDSITLNSSEDAEAENKAAAFLESVSEADKVTYGFESKMIEDVFKEHAIAKKMYDKAVNSEEIKIDEERYRQVQVQFIQVMTEGTSKDGTPIHMTDEEKKKALTRANKLLEKAKAEEDFEVFAKKKSNAKEINAEFSKDDMPKEYGEAALALKTGEYSDVIEGTDGYYIVYCVSDNVEKVTDKNIQKALEDKESERFQSVYTSWSKDCSAEVSVKLWKQISIV